MKKQVLIISYAYPPNNVPGAQRPYALAKYLDKEKYKVTVITCSNPDLPLGQNEGFNPELEGVEIIKIRSKIGNKVAALRTGGNDREKKFSIINKLKSFFFKIGQSVVFPDKGMFWSSNVFSYLKNSDALIEQTNFVFSSSPGMTDHILAKYVKSKKPDIKWIADFRDFNYVENWSLKSGYKARRHKKLEHSIVENADAITFVTKTMQEAYQKFYSKRADKMFCIYNGLEKTDTLFLENNGDETAKISFFYAGSFYRGLRSPIPLLQLLDKSIEENLLKESDIIVRIAGSIEEETKEAMTKYTSFKSVEFLGNLPRAEVLREMEQATFLWLIVANIKSHYQTVPIKLFEYMAARRPIINFAPSISEASHLIEQNQLGFNFNTLDFDLKESYKIFTSLINMIKEGKLKQSLPEDKIDLFSWKNQMKLMEKIIAECR